jgi:ADP-ribose pyrophosphatase YjhB (NUDIX family)
MNNYKCEKGCCTLKIKDYVRNNLNIIPRKRKKAGVFIYDPKQNKVLIVQSRGRLWGPPKGTLDMYETERRCAIREVKEETGLEIKDEEFTRVANIKNKAIYFYVEKDETDVYIQENVFDNDANGVGWINIECLAQCLENGNMNLSRHSHIVFKRFLNKEFIEGKFTLVGREIKLF